MFNFFIFLNNNTILKKNLYFYSTNDLNLLLIFQFIKTLYLFFFLLLILLILCIKINYLLSTLLIYILLVFC
jgi:hypothetical protein